MFDRLLAQRPRCRAEILQVKQKMLPSAALAADAVWANGRYRLLRRIGEGGFTEVWQAADTTDEPIALKILAVQATADERLRRRFLRGAALLGSLHHPGLVHAREGDRDAARPAALALAELWPPAHAQRTLTTGRRTHQDIDALLPYPALLRVATASCRGRTSGGGPACGRPLAPRSSRRGSRCHGVGGSSGGVCPSQYLRFSAIWTSPLAHFTPIARTL